MEIQLRDGQGARFHSAAKRGDAKAGGDAKARKARSVFFGWATASLLLLSACEEKKENGAEKATSPAAASTAEAAVPPPPPKSAPPFIVDEVGPMVGFSRVMLTTSEGKRNLLGADQLRKELLAEKIWIEGKEVRLVVDRKAKPEWVALYLSELTSFAPSSVKISTETRSEYPKEVPVVLPSEGRGLASCTLVGTITSDRATAIWRLQGGTARKRARGMGGPDLTMTGDTILSLKKTCAASDVFVVHGAEGVEWGLIYDLGASGIALPKSELTKLYIPLERPTPGQAVKL